MIRDNPPSADFNRLLFSRYFYNVIIIVKAVLKGFATRDVETVEGKQKEKGSNRIVAMCQYIDISITDVD